MWCLYLDLGVAGGVPKSSFPFSLPKKGERAGGEAGQGAGKGCVTCPSADQAREVHWGGSALLLVLITSCFSSSTMIFPSRSCAGQEKKRQGTRRACSETPVAKPNPSDSEMLRNSLWVSAGMQSDGIEVSSRHAGGFLEQGTGTGPPVYGVRAVLVEPLAQQSSTFEI